MWRQTGGAELVLPQSMYSSLLCCEYFSCGSLTWRNWRIWLVLPSVSRSSSAVTITIIGRPHEASGGLTLHESLYFNDRTCGRRWRQLKGERIPLHMPLARRIHHSKSSNAKAGLTERKIWSHSNCMCDKWWQPWMSYGFFKDCQPKPLKM